MPLPPLPNITGGHASSGTGDLGFSTGETNFGGINYKTGVPPFYLLLGAVALYLVFNAKN